MTNTPATPEPAYLRWRKDNRIAGTLVIASLSTLSNALCVIFGLNVGRGSLVYIAVLLAAAMISGLIMTHNRIALALGKPLLLILSGATIFGVSVHRLNGRASLICCASGALLAFAYVVVARGKHWDAFSADVRSGEDTTSAAVRYFRDNPEQ